MNFLELVKARYSARKYANRPVEAEKLDYIMECVRFAPSAVNFQPWRFRIVTDEAVLKALYSCYKREWLATAPCIIVACVDHNESWHRRADNKDHADIDIAIAVEHLCLAAAEQGLGTCCIYHGAAGGYEGGAALYRFAEGRGFCRIITPDCFWKGECFMGAYSRQYSYEYLAGACCASWSALSDADFQ